jgi:hypothetical protein
MGGEAREATEKENKHVFQTPNHFHIIVWIKNYWCFMIFSYTHVIKIYTMGNIN